MKGIVYKQKNSLVSLTGNTYTQPVGSGARLYVKHENGNVPFGLTTNSSASQYCGIRMKIDGQTAYIGRRETATTSVVNTYDVATYSTYEKINETTKTYTVEDSWQTTRESWYDQHTTTPGKINSTVTWEKIQTTGVGYSKPYSRTLSISQTNYDAVFMTYKYMFDDYHVIETNSQSQGFAGGTKTSACGSYEYMNSSSDSHAYLTKSASYTTKISSNTQINCLYVSDFYLKSQQNFVN